MKNNSNTTYDDFLSNPSLSSFTFQPITEESIINMIIDKLKSKNSQSHDGLSSKHLKVIKHETSKAITLIVNQSLNTGIFPDKLKCAYIYIYLLHLFTQGKPIQLTLVFIGALHSFHIVTNMYAQYIIQYSQIART